VYIRTFGRFETISKGKIIKDRDWKSQKASSLFRYLIANRNKKIPVEVIYSLFWEGMNEDYARINLNSTLHTIRKVTGLTSQELSLRGKTCYLSVDSENMKVDADEFEKYIELSEKAASTPERIDYLKKAEDIYKGPFLVEEFYMSWSQDERKKYEMMYMKVLDELAELLYEEGRYDECLNYLYKYLNNEPYNEKNYYKAISILISIGRVREGMDLYNKMKKFLDEIGLEPVKEFEELVCEHEAKKGGQTSDEKLDLQDKESIKEKKKRREKESIVLKVLFKRRISDIKNLAREIAKFLRKDDELFYNSHAMYLRFSRIREEDKVFLERRILGVLNKMGIGKNNIEFIW